MRVSAWYVPLGSRKYINKYVKLFHEVSSCFLLIAVYQLCDALLNSLHYFIVYYSITITGMVLTSAVSDTQESLLQTLNLVEELQVRNIRWKTWKNNLNLNKEII